MTSPESADIEPLAAKQASAEADLSQGVADDPQEIQRIIREIVSPGADLERTLTEESEVRRVIVLSKVKSKFDLPTLSSIARLLNQAFSIDEVDIGEIVDMIEADASLTARIIKLANSPLMRGAMEIESVHETVLRLGTRTILQIINSMRVVDAGRELAPGFDWTHLWKHNFATSILSGNLQTIFGVEGGLAGGTGLIHDLGKVILSDLFPAEYAAVIQKAYNESSSMREQELAVFGIAHEEVGVLFAVHNEFPKRIQEALLYQEAPDKAPTYRSQAAILQVANYFAKLHGIGYSGDRRYLAYSYDELEGWKVLMEEAAPSQKEAMERYEGYLRTSLRTSFMQARHQVDSMFFG